MGKVKFCFVWLSVASILNKSKVVGLGSNFKGLEKGRHKGIAKREKKCPKNRLIDLREICRSQ